MSENKPTAKIENIRTLDQTTLNNEASLFFSKNKNNPAEWTYERLIALIKDFEDNLNEDQEIGARLASFGSELTFHIDDIGYHGPDIIIFYGITNDGQAVTLIQNIAQLSVLLMAMRKINDPPKRIGFIHE